LAAILMIAQNHVRNRLEQGIAETAQWNCKYFEHRL
jgi:hypothetical protein